MGERDDRDGKSVPTERRRGSDRRTGEDRRKRDTGPPDGVERRTSERRKGERRQS